MIKAGVIDEIRNWFQKNPKFEFMNPGQNSLRPGDSVYTMENIYENEGKLIIEMCDRRKFIINGDIQYRFIDGSLEIDNFELLIFEWNDDGHGQRFDGRTNVGPECFIYNDGRLLFMPYKDPFNPKFYEDQFNPAFWPK